MVYLHANLYNTYMRRCLSTCLRSRPWHGMIKFQETIDMRRRIHPRPTYNTLPWVEINYAVYTLCTSLPPPILFVELYSRTQRGVHALIPVKFKSRITIQLKIVRFWKSLNLFVLILKKKKNNNESYDIPWRRKFIDERGRKIFVGYKLLIINIRRSPVL